MRYNKIGSYQLFHAVPDLVLADRPLEIVVAVKTECESVPSHLTLHMQGDGREYALLPTVSPAKGYTLYALTLPPDAVRAGELAYTVEGELFSTSVLAGDALPPLPALTVTELFVRPRGYRIFGVFQSDRARG